MFSLDSRRRKRGIVGGGSLAAVAAHLRQRTRARARIRILRLLPAAASSSSRRRTGALPRTSSTAARGVGARRQAGHELFERSADSARTVAPATGGIAVFVSHRFSTVRMADRIVVVDGGRIAEHGSHEELLARGGIYAELYALQASAYN
jgi:hypothetical protein